MSGKLQSLIRKPELTDADKTASIKATNVLDEEAYTEELGSIIERDFFPDLKKLRAQNEYLEAEEKNDVIKIRELQKKYCDTNSRIGTSYSSSCSTPQTFETPASKSQSKSPTHFPEFDLTKEKDKNKSELSVDKFLARNTSEDNASFSDIMKISDQKHREKHGWLYDKEKEHEERQKQALALPDIEKQNSGKLALSSSVENWTYTNKNALMYVPDGVALSAKEKLEQKPGREIKHTNTRYTYVPFNDSANKTAISVTAAIQAKSQEGKIGVDGKEIVPDDAPTINGYGFVNPEPSLVPGVTESPLITWGEIEGTPFRLDGGDTPRSSHKLSCDGPTFKIPNVSKRDRIAHSLAEDVLKTKRSKKEEALEHVRSRLRSTSPRFGLNSPHSPFDRLNDMSPAARALANRSLGISKNTDKSLRESYTPSPAHQKTASQTPTPTRQSSVRSEPKETVDTPETAITDNLLNIPNRMKASDFF